MCIFQKSFLYRLGIIKIFIRDNISVNKADPCGQIAANIICAVICGIVGAVGYFLTNWLANKIGLKGWKRKVFVWGLSAVISADVQLV